METSQVCFHWATMETPKLNDIFEILCLNIVTFWGRGGRYQYQYLMGTEFSPKQRKYKVWRNQKRVCGILCKHVIKSDMALFSHQTGTEPSSLEISQLTAIRGESAVNLFFFFTTIWKELWQGFWGDYESWCFKLSKFSHQIRPSN